MQYFFTFNLAHKHFQRYAVIDALGPDSARREFTRLYGYGAIGVQYSEHNWKNWQGLTVAQRLNLKVIE